MTLLREEQRRFTAAHGADLTPDARREQRRRIATLRLEADLMLARAVAQLRGLGPAPASPLPTGKPGSCR